MVRPLFVLRLPGVRRGVAWCAWRGVRGVARAVRVAWCGVVWRGRCAWRGVVRVAWCGVVWRGVAWCGVVRVFCGAVRTSCALQLPQTISQEVVTFVGRSTVWLTTQYLLSERWTALSSAFRLTSPVAT